MQSERDHQGQVNLNGPLSQLDTYLFEWLPPLNMVMITTLDSVLRQSREDERLGSNISRRQSSQMHGYLILHL